MQDLKFYKFDGAGNDFILLDCRKGPLDLSPEQIEQLCHRRFGIGADGLMMLLDGGTDYDFRMRYYNSDGYPADMCGNGGRCIAMFYHLLTSNSLYLNPNASLYFIADDGPHEAQVLHWDDKELMGLVKLSMRDVPGKSVRRVLDGWLLNTGVPHYVQQVDDLAHFDVVGEGRRLRHHPDLGPEGANVNFVQPMPDGTLRIRTYERGVEDETLACGTGVTACAIATGVQTIDARGGNFRVEFTHRCGDYTHVFLTGPVSLNFTGTVRLDLKLES